MLEVIELEGVRYCANCDKVILRDLPKFKKIHAQMCYGIKARGKCDKNWDDYPCCECA